MTKLVDLQLFQPFNCLREGFQFFFVAVPGRNKVLELVKEINELLQEKERRLGIPGPEQTKIRE